ncbi:hypothetical protein ACMFMF_006174 [Clarireedia jacksonii]
MSLLCLDTLDPNDRPGSALKGDGARNRLLEVVKVVESKGNYVYEAIDYNEEIRVLHLLSGKQKSAIFCRLLTTSLKAANVPLGSSLNKLAYCALSYNWGEKGQNKIYIYEQPSTGTDSEKRKHAIPDWKHTYIQDNLMHALTQLRSEMEEVYLWVDALCIDQGNPGERSAQVARMHEIYSNAEKVCVWLGNPSEMDEAKKTFDFLTKILNLATFEDLVTRGENPKDWLLIIHLMKKDWFSRRWIIQELALTTNAWIRYGTEEMPWTLAADAIALFMTSFAEIKQILVDAAASEPTNRTWETADVGALDARALGANTLVTTTNRLFRRANDNGHIEQRSLTLEVLVSSLLLPFEAKDPRDTVYAALSIAKDIWRSEPELEIGMKWEAAARRTKLLWAGVLIFHWVLLPLIMLPITLLQPSSIQPMTLLDPRIQPNYQKCLLDVYADFMEYCIEKSQNLDILIRNWAPMEEKKTRRELLYSSTVPAQDKVMPSWVPDIELSAFGAAHRKQRGRMNGDSFVDGSDRQKTYNASLGLKPTFKFGKFNTDVSSNNSPINSNTTSSAEHSQNKGNETKQLPPKFTGVLEVDGFQLADICQITDAVTTGVVPVTALEMGGWDKDIRKEERKLRDELWRTMCGDRGPNGTHTPNWYRRACLFCLEHQVDHEGNFGTNNLRPASRTRVVRSFVDRVQAVVWKRRFFRTPRTGEHGKKSLFGLAPFGAKENDVVCILLGCTVPVVLRHDGDFWRLIGECFVFSMMDGEAITGDWPKRLETFKLK